jgi:hypothetical protein
MPRFTLWGCVMLDLVTPRASLPQAPSQTVMAVPQNAHHATFHNLLSELNPLQYLPILGTIYRAVTGDTIPEAARTIGSFVVSGLIGGPIGLATNAALLAIEKVTGIDPEKIGQDLLASLGIGHHGADSVAAAVQSTTESAPQTPLASVAWSHAQLTAYGVTMTAGGLLTRGELQGADVLNDLELAQHGRVFGGSIAT